MIDSRIRYASQKQFDFIKRLLAEREVSADLSEDVSACRALAVAGMLESRRASALIDALLAAPKKAEEAPAEIEAGIYSYAATLYRVYLGQKSGRMLVKKVTAQYAGNTCYCSDLQGVLCGVCRGDLERRHVSGISYEYLGTADKALPAKAERLSIEEVGSLGLAWNHCVICGRRLDDPESVDRGIGPVCARKY